MTNIKTISIFTIILLIFMTSYSCKKKESKKEPKVNTNTTLTITKEIKDLLYIKGDESSNIVIVNAQGGPMLELASSEFDDILKDVNTDNILCVNVHQAQTQSPNLFSSSDITFDEAKTYDSTTINNIYKVVKYFKDQERKVYVLGISFGSFVTQELIAQKGIDVADRYLIMVGRLDINDVFWQGFSQGKAGYFNNGITPVIIDQTDITDKNMCKLAAGLGFNRYTQVLNKYTDLSKITYIYGQTDDAVGKLTDAEIQFLQSKNVKIISGPGTHSQTIDNYIVKGFKEAFGIE